MCTALQQLCQARGRFIPQFKSITKLIMSAFQFQSTAACRRARYRRGSERACRRQSDGWGPGSGVSGCLGCYPIVSIPCIRLPHLGRNRFGRLVGSLPDSVCRDGCGCFCARFAGRAGDPFGYSFGECARSIPYFYLHPQWRCWVHQGMYASDGLYANVD